MVLPIIGSKSDLKLAKQIQSELLCYEIESTIRICSAHKEVHLLTNMLDIYENTNSIKLYNNFWKIECLKFINRWICKLSSYFMSTNYRYKYT